MIRFGLLLVALFAMQASSAQNVKSEDISYHFIKLPLNPLPQSVKNYQSSIFANYEADNKKKKDQYEAELKQAELEYQKEVNEYPAKVKAAEAKYQLAKAEWDKKSMGEKFVEKQVLNEDNKPVKEIPPKPSKRYVSKPDLKTSYDYPVIAKTYLILEGFENNPSNAVKVDAVLYGYDYTQPRQLTEVKDIVVRANGTTTTTKQTYYHVEFSYRHTMSVKVTGPDGKEIFYITPQELNSYKMYKSSESQTPVTYNEEQLVKKYEAQILQENLTFINNLVNDKIGYKRELRNTSLSFVKAKDESYSDLLIAFNDASSGLKILLDEPELSKSKLQNAVQLWNTALKSSDMNNKKARIDKEVAIMIYFNLLEVYFALGDVQAAESIMNTLNAVNISKSERRLKDEYEVLFNDLKKRITANKF